MAVPIKLILLICVIEAVRAQFPEVDNGGISDKPRPHGRFLPRPGNRPAGSPLQSQRIRRPLPLKSSKPPTGTNEFSPFTAARPRPNFLPSLKVVEHSSTPPPQLLQQDQPTKPVSEDSKEEEDNINLPPIVKIGPIAPPFFQPQNNIFSNSPLTPKPQPIIHQFRPSPTPPLAPAHHQSNPLLEENIAPIQYHPAKPIKFRKPIDVVPEIQHSVRQQHQPQYHHQQQQQKPPPQQQQQQQPQQQGYIRQSPKKATSYREKKPVAQIIRRWREDNDDGSITWGFENDDGSYKEEIIGIDCVTRGKYGYVDPDGNRREYTYETGIKCDEEQQQDNEDNGFVDYQENKLVLPNGKTIDLSSMGKKQARRPQPIYRN